MAYKHMSDPVDRAKFKIEDALKTLTDYADYIDKTTFDPNDPDHWRIIYALNSMGYSLIKVDSLKAYYATKEFAESNGMEFINHTF
jgi:hypothetical protein